jgi:hypothetical protein
MNNDHIPTSEVLQDIRDTESEIIQMEKEEKGLRIIGDKMSIFKADARREGIKERKIFIEKLEGILKERRGDE